MLWVFEWGMNFSILLFCQTNGSKMCYFVTVMKFSKYNKYPICHRSLINRIWAVCVRIDIWSTIYWWRDVDSAAARLHCLVMWLVRSQCKLSQQKMFEKWQRRLHIMTICFKYCQIHEYVYWNINKIQYIQQTVEGLYLLSTYSRPMNGEYKDML